MTLCLATTYESGKDAHDETASLEASNSFKKDESGKSSWEYSIDQPAQTSNTATAHDVPEKVDQVVLKSGDDESGLGSSIGPGSSSIEPEADINALLTKSFKKKTNTSPVVGDIEQGSLSSDESSQEEPRPRKFGLKDLRRASIESMQYDPDESDRQHSVSMDAVLQAPNPFLDDTSSDEETGLPPVVRPFETDVPRDETISERHDNEHDKDADENQLSPKDSGQKCTRKKKLMWVALLIVVSLAAVIGSAVAGQSKKNNPDQEPNTPSVPSDPTRLPTSQPTPLVIPNWVQVGGDLVGEESGDEAGFSVSSSADGLTVIVGARRSAKDGMKNRGAARIFQFDSATGFYVPITDIYGEAAGDQCGFSVSMSSNGKRVAIGSLGSDKNGQNSGAVRIFEQSLFSEEWEMTKEFIGESATSLFGSSVALSGDGSRLVVGAPYYSEGDTTRSGRSYVYDEVEETVWEAVGGPVYGTSSDDLFGWSVSLSSDSQFVAVGAPRLEGSLDSGYVKVFNLIDNSWQVYGETITMESPGDRFGFSISLAGNETLQRIAIGSPGANVNGQSSGLAALYENANSTWTKVGTDVFGMDSGDNFGYSISMTPDAERVAVGAPNKNIDNVPVGQIQVIDVRNNNTLPAGEMLGREDDDKVGVSVSISSEGKLIFGGASLANLVRAYAQEKI